LNDLEGDGSFLLIDLPRLGRSVPRETEAILGLGGRRSFCVLSSLGLALAQGEPNLVGVRIALGLYCLEHALFVKASRRPPPPPQTHPPSSPDFHFLAPHDLEDTLSDVPARAWPESPGFGLA
jgi:hypothetical protein